ncbi:MAG: hypothetical protein K0S36_1742 [Nitrosospira multiformis]|nr:hypothetical protein [Nitrosospira multiformis]
MEYMSDSGAVSTCFCSRRRWILFGTRHAPRRRASLCKRQITMDWIKSIPSLRSAHEERGCCVAKLDPGSLRLRLRLAQVFSGSNAGRETSANRLRMFSCCHLAAVLRALAASLHTLFHSIQLFATFSTSVANFGTDTTDLGTESGAAEHEIQRRLADFRAIHHQSEVICLNMFAA